MANKEVLDEYIILKDLDASIRISKIDENTRDRVYEIIYNNGYRYTARIGYPESIGERGYYKDGFIYKTYPTKKEIRIDVLDLFELVKKELENRLLSGNEEITLKKISKVLRKNKRGN